MTLDLYRFLTFLISSVLKQPVSIRDQRIFSSLKHAESNEQAVLFARRLHEALISNQLSEFCDEQSTKAKTPDLKLLWSFMSARSMNCSKKRYLELLLNEKLKETKEDSRCENIDEDLNSCTTYDDSSDDVDESVNGCFVAPSINLKDFCSAEVDLLKSLCENDLQWTVNTALRRKQLSLALLIAFCSSDEEIARSIVLHLQGVHPDPYKIVRQNCLAGNEQDLWFYKETTIYFPKMPQIKAATSGQ
ncbi:unnamed protein product [Thelazia callipaeda]|uniref:ELM2 domain-containing protein n=1 Tax=Thelazia callipaeda TaxID=103827 RepID=A0A0N5D2J4_THECL|nr:unnamed protein product [Thelazia callipaeda]